MTVLLMRHAQTDWSQVEGRRWPGAANDFAQLTPRGIEQAEQAARDLAGAEIAMVRSSPMTRALQTAAIVSARLAVPLEVWLDLREWLPEERFTWTGENVLELYDDMIAHGGVRPEGHPYQWEPLAEVRERALAVLRDHVGAGDVVLAVTHEVTIHALTGHQGTPHATVRPLVEAA